MELLHAKRYGEGPPLIILHGFLGMLDNWKTIGKKFAEKGFEVHLVDQRNHGKSFWSQDFSYEVMAEDLKRYLKHHNLSNVVLLGHSMGGKTAMEFAVSYPEQINALLVADISPRYYPPHHQEIIHALNQLPLDTLNSRSKAEEILSQYLDEAGVRQFLLKNLYWIDKERLGFRANLEVLGENLDEIGAPITATGIFSGPALFLLGEKSEYIGPQDVPIIKRHFPNAEFSTIPNSGHWLHAENPKAFLESSISFLNAAGY